MSVPVRNRVSQILSYEWDTKVNKKRKKVGG
jgi:hypothetical protein